jgi:hypothetical protein
MKLNVWRTVLGMTLAASMLLLQGCAGLYPPGYTSPPPLPPQARQPELPAMCSPTCSERLRLDYETWRLWLTNPALPATPASAPIKP